MSKLRKSTKNLKDLAFTILPKFKANLLKAMSYVFVRITNLASFEEIEGKIYPKAAEGEYKLYLIKNKANDKEYVGITVSSLHQRLFAAHLCCQKFKSTTDPLPGNSKIRCRSIPNFSSAKRCQKLPRINAARV